MMPQRPAVPAPPSPTTAPALRRWLGASACALALAGCADGAFDWDLRPTSSGASTAEAARQATAARPTPDARGIISYPGFQVAVARRGDTVTTVAERVGISAGELARYNALAATDALRDGEVLALPRRVAEPAPGAGARPATGGIDVTAIASTAIDRADGQRTAAATPAAGTPTPAGTRAPDRAADGAQPVRHQVVRGETAFSIARLYNVSTRALAEWNGLGSDMMVREGQYLLIPVPAATPPQQQQQAAAVPQPGTGSATPTPPSAAQPLPAQNAGAAATPRPPSPDLGAPSGGRLAMPVEGRIFREYVRGRNEGIGFAADAGTPVRAADAGTVAAITRDTDQVPILVIRHANNLLTVYAGIDDIQVERGAQVRRGQTIARVRAGNPSFLHFEVREGFDSVDPMRYLQ